MPGNLPKDTPPELQKKISEIETQTEKVTKTFFERAPLAKEVPERGFVLAEIGGVTFLYTKINDNLKRVAFTNV